MIVLLKAKVCIITDFFNDILLCLVSVIGKSINLTKKHGRYVTELLVMPLQVKFKLILASNTAALAQLRMFYF